jgi:abhydrolase domain-containing protein 17
VDKLIYLSLNIIYRGIVIYLILCVVIYFLSNRSIFVPPASTYHDNKNIIKIRTANSNNISAIYLRNPNAKYTILYSHGNAEDIGMILPLLQEYYSWGFSVIGYDYQGYGTSTGTPTEQNSYADIKSVYEYLTLQQHTNPQHIILFGRSLGSGPSIELATKVPVAGVIIESGFTTIYRVVTHIPIFWPDKYKNLAKINHLKIPVLFIHGEKDNIIPIWHSKKLYDTYLGPKKFYWIPNVGHNDIVIDATYKSNIMNWVNGLTS